MGIATLHLTNAYHPQSGGIRTMYHALMAQAEREGRRMALVVPSDEDRTEPIGMHTVVHHVRAPHAPAFDRRYRTILPHRFLRPDAGRLWSILDRERPDLVEVCDKYSLCYFAGLVRKRRQRLGVGPTLVGSSCERLDDNLRAHVSGHRLSAAAARLFLGRVYIGMFDAHVANSAYTAEELHAAMTAPHRRPVHVGLMGVHVGAPLSDAERSRHRVAVRDRLSLTSECVLVTYAGRLSPEKHAEALAHVAARLTHRGAAHLVIAGDGPSREPLARACRDLRATAVTFVGHLDSDALRQLLAASDLFVHPNPHEPFGIGPLEAMAAGVPLVAPRSGGILSYATDENAWLTPPVGEALAVGVDEALSSRAGRVRRAIAARQTAERFAWPGAAARLLRTYDMIHEARVFGPDVTVPRTRQAAPAATSAVTGSIASPQT